MKIKCLRKDKSKEDRIIYANLNKELSQLIMDRIKHFKKIMSNH